MMALQTEADFRTAAHDIERMQTECKRDWPGHVSLSFDKSSSALSITPLLLADAFAPMSLEAIKNVALCAKLFHDSMRHIEETVVGEVGTASSTMQGVGALTEAFLLAREFQSGTQIAATMKMLESEFFWSLTRRRAGSSCRDLRIVDDAEWICILSAGAAPSRFGAYLMASASADDTNLQRIVDSINCYVVATSLVYSVQYWRKDLERSRPSILMSAAARQSYTLVRESLRLHDASLVRSVLSPLAVTYLRLAQSYYERALQHDDLPTPWRVVVTRSASQLTTVLAGTSFNGADHSS